VEFSWDRGKTFVAPTAPQVHQSRPVRLKNAGFALVASRPLVPRLCCKSRFAQVVKNPASCGRVFRIKMLGTDPLTLNSPATSATRLRVHESGIVSRFSFSRKIRGAATFGFCNTFPPEADIGTAGIYEYTS